MVAARPPLGEGEEAREPLEVPRGAAAAAASPPAGGAARLGTGAAAAEREADANDEDDAVPEMLRDPFWAALATLVFADDGTPAAAPGALPPSGTRTTGTGAKLTDNGAPPRAPVAALAAPDGCAAACLTDGTGGGRETGCAAAAAAAGRGGGGGLPLPRERRAPRRDQGRHPRGAPAGAQAGDAGALRGGFLRCVWGVGSEWVGH